MSWLRLPQKLPTSSKTQLDKHETLLAAFRRWIEMKVVAD